MSDRQTLNDKEFKTETDRQTKGKSKWQSRKLDWKIQTEKDRQDKKEKRKKETNKQRKREREIKGKHA